MQSDEQVATKGFLMQVSTQLTPLRWKDWAKISNCISSDLKMSRLARPRAKIWLFSVLHATVSSFGVMARFRIFELLFSILNTLLCLKISLASSDLS